MRCDYVFVLIPKKIRGVFHWDGIAKLPFQRVVRLLMGKNSSGYMCGDEGPGAHSSNGVEVATIFVGLSCTSKEIFG